MRSWQIVEAIAGILLIVAQAMRRGLTLETITERIRALLGEDK